MLSISCFQDEPAPSSSWSSSSCATAASCAGAACARRVTRPRPEGASSILLRGCCLWRAAQRRRSGQASDWLALRQACSDQGTWKQIPPVPQRKHEEGLKDPKDVTTRAREGLIIRRGCRLKFLGAGFGMSTCLDGFKTHSAGLAARRK
eukprot:1952738-Prymnesium_polylepis.1